MGLFDEEEDDTEEMPPESEEGGSDVASAASAAFPDQEWSSERLAALKDLIHLCGSSDYEEEKPKKEKGAGFDLIFGAPKKK
jgi:hypothetical protein